MLIDLAKHVLCFLLVYRLLCVPVTPITTLHQPQSALDSNILPVFNTIDVSRVPLVAKKGPVEVYGIGEKTGKEKS
jgi:hypothetical protein